MKTLSANEAKYCFGRLIDAARAEPVVFAKHGRPVVVFMVVDACEQLTGDKAADVTEDKMIPMNNKSPISRGRNRK